MADEAGDKSAAKVMAFTPSETKILLSMIQRMEGEFKFDADAVATDCGLKDSKTVKTRWSQIKKKITSDATTPAGGIDKSSPSKKAAAQPKSAVLPKNKGGRKGKAAKAVGEDGEGEQMDEKPVKKEQNVGSDDDD